MRGVQREGRAAGVNASRARRVGWGVGGFVVGHVSGFVRRLQFLEPGLAPGRGFA